MHPSIRLILTLNLLLLFPLLGMSQSVDVYDYLSVNNHQQDYSKLVLKETYVQDKSKQSPYKKRFLHSREEFDVYGRTSLNLFYDPYGKMEAKVIMFYPQYLVEKGIFKQKQGYIDSAVYLYHKDGQRDREIWYWGENSTQDTFSYSYNTKKQLTGVRKNYDWDTKRDTFIYNNNQRLSKAITYSEVHGMQKEVQFVYGFDSILLKINTLNRHKLVIEEEFFFYNKKGQVSKTISKYYPEGNEIIDPPRMITKKTYYGNGTLKQILKKYYNRQEKQVSISDILYTPLGYMKKRFDKNKRDGIWKKTVVQYTIQKHRRLRSIP